MSTWFISRVAMSAASLAPYRLITNCTPPSFRHQSRSRSAAPRGSNLRKPGLRAAADVRRRLARVWQSPDLPRARSGERACPPPALLPSDCADCPGHRGLKRIQSRQSQPELPGPARRARLLPSIPGCSALPMLLGGRMLRAPCPRPPPAHYMLGLQPQRAQGGSRARHPAPFRAGPVQPCLCPRAGPSLCG